MTQAAVSLDGRASTEALRLPAIHSSWPTFDEQTIADVSAVLRSGKVNALHHGDRGRAFEKAFADLCNVPHAAAVSNGTVALELALRAMGIGPGDEVVVPARSFMASASCVCAVGATPIFADIDPVSQSLTVRTIAPMLSPQTRAIIVVHLAGWPAPMEGIVRLARLVGLKVLEDCAQAHGATIKQRPVGSFGDAAAFSFCTDKIISTGGEGGMVVTPHAEIFRHVWAGRDHGKTPEGLSEPAPPGVFRWLHESIGSNLRLTEMQAAIGLRQYSRLPAMLARRRENAAILDNALADLPALRLTVPPPTVGHAYYKYYCFIRPDQLADGWSRDRIMADLHHMGVPCGSGSCPEIYRERAFRGSRSIPRERLPNARLLGQTSLMLPVDHTLEATDMLAMAERLRALLRTATR